MFVEAAHRLDITVAILDAPNAPAKQINAKHPHVNGSFKNPKDVRKLADECDILTVEIEHIDTEVLEDLSEGFDVQDDWRLVKGKKIEVQPSWKTLRIIQDKYKQKEHLIADKVETAESIPLDGPTTEALEAVGSKLDFPFMLKSRTEAYDGRGNFPVKSAKDFTAALEALANRPLYAERWAHFKMELAVMVVKTDESASSGAWESSTLAYPVVETVHENSICKLVFAPARNVSESVREKAKRLARRAVSSFPGKGVFGVEMFLLENGKWIT